MKGMSDVRGADGDACGLHLVLSAFTRVRSRVFEKGNRIMESDSDGEGGPGLS